MSGPGALVRDGDDVAIRDDDGSVSMVRSTDLGAAIAEGARPATEREWQDAKLGKAGTVAAAAVGAGQGISFGYAAPAALGALETFGATGVADDLRRGIQIAKDVRPEAYLGGELAGAAVPMFFGAPPGAGAVAGDTALARAAARAAQVAPRAAFEGGAIGLGTQLTEDALGKHETTAQKAVVSTAGGAIFGLLLGTATHAGLGHLADGFARRAAPSMEEAATRGLSSYGARDVEALAEREFGATERGVGKSVVEDIRQAYGKGSAAVSGKDRNLINEFTRLDATGREARRIAVFDAEKELETAQRELRAQGDTLLRENPELMSEFRGAMKAEKIAASVAPDKAVRRVPFIDIDAGLAEEAGAIRPFKIGKPTETVNFNGTTSSTPGEISLGPKVEMQNAPRGGRPIGIETVVEVPEGAAYAKKEIARVMSLVEADLAEGTSKSSVAMLRDIVRSANESQAEISAAIKSGEKVNVTAFMALDRLKRDVQGFTDGGYRRVGMMTNPVEARLARKTVDKLNGLQNDLRHGLESTERWGKAGEIQAKINADWSTQIEASKRFHKALTTEVGRRPDNPFLKLRGVDPTRLETYTNSLTNPKNDLTHTAVRDYVTSTESLARTMRENLTLDAEQLARVTKIEEAAKRFRATVDKAEKTLTTLNQYKALTGKTADSAAALAASLGFAAGGPVGGLIGAGAGALASPGRVVAQLASLERMGAKIEEKFGSSAAAFFSGKAPKALPKSTAPAVTNETVRDLLGLVRNPAALRARIADAIAPYADIAPKVAQGMATTLMRAAAHLASTLPPDPEPMGISFVPRPPRKLSEVQLASARKTIEGINDADAVARDLAHKRVSREHIAAMQDVYPDLFEILKAKVREEARTQRPKLTLQQEVALSMLFKEPLTPMMQQKRIQAFQKMFAESAPPQQQPPGGGGQPVPIGKIGGARQGAWDRIEGDR